MSDFFYVRKTFPDGYVSYEKGTGMVAVPKLYTLGTSSARVKALRKKLPKDVIVERVPLTIVIGDPVEVP